MEKGFYKFLARNLVVSKESDSLGIHAAIVVRAREPRFSAEECYVRLFRFQKKMMMMMMKGGSNNNLVVSLSLSLSPSLSLAL